MNNLFAGITLTLSLISQSIGILHTLPTPEFLSPLISSTPYPLTNSENTPTSKLFPPSRRIIFPTSNFRRKNSSPTITSTKIPFSTLTLTPTPTISGLDCCSFSQLQSGYQCIQDCGPHVVRISDPPPGFSCLSPQDIQNRQRFGCPICLSTQTKIKTYTGEMIITDITPGTIVWTVDKNGALVLAPVIAVSHTPVTASHKMSHLVLKDGRNLLVSPNHPTIDEKTVGQLKKGDLYDGSTVALNDLVNYTDGRTYDILPAGDTGFYFANGILLASTLKK